MIFDYDKCFCSGCQREVPRDRRCGPTLREQIDELRSRLQALEQNTVPSREAKQKPHEWTLAAWRLPGSAIWNVGPRGISTPEPTERKTIRVREVLDD